MGLPVVHPTPENAASSLSHKGRFYRPELDVVRFIAFTSVFLHHLLPHDLGKVHRLGSFAWSAGAKWHMVEAESALGFGLPLFFMLSAYLIGELLLREKDQFKTVNLRAFYTRRILRIWPLYFFGIFIGVCYAVFADHSRLDLKVLIAFFFMMSTLAPGGSNGPMAPLWSISVEEQFYLFCPVIIKTLTSRGLWVFSSALIVISDTVLFFMGHAHVVTETTWHSSLVQFQMFGAGLLLCLALHARRLEFPKWARATCLLVAPCAWYGACRVLGRAVPGAIASGVSLILGYSLASLGCLLILRGFIGLNAKWCPRWAVWLGKISFGLYVYHKVASRIMMSFFTAQTLHWLLSSFALTVLLAALSYRYLETPFLKIKKRFELIHSRA